MKTIFTIKQSLLALTIALSIVSCKKDKKDPEPAPPTEVKAISLTDLKALSTSASVKVPDGKKISGIVISDAAGKNTDSKTVVLQEAADKPGILINFAAAQTFAVGDQVEVNISNQTLAQVDGEVVLTNVPAANAKKTGTGTIAAKVTTAAAIATNKTAWDGTLVQLPAGAFSGGNGKFSGTLTYTDASGAVKSNVLAGAAFENTDYSTSIDAVTGIVRISGNDVRVDIRNANDVSTAVKYLLTEDFKTATVDKNNGSSLIFFITANGKYNAINNTKGLFLPLAGDDFLDQSRKYLYLVQPDYLQSVETGTVNLKGLKTVSITFAGSKYKGDIDLENPISTDIVHVLPFDAAKHKVGIRFYFLNDNYGGFTLETVQFSSVGQFNTVTVKIPQSVDEFVSVLLKDPDWAGISLDDAKVVAADFMANNFRIGFANHSTNRITNKDADPSDGNLDVHASGDSDPIIIDKIVYGFNEKPQ